ncbi:MAG: hypothetical protein GXY53_03080 [Desulfobulbus sp.]|nr:hypothetical protein [Desulfobulbus sp.]
MAAATVQTAVKNLSPSRRKSAGKKTANASVFAGFFMPFSVNEITGQATSSL